MPTKKQPSITLGGVNYPIAQLKLGQMRQLLDALDDLSKNEGGGEAIDAMVDVVVAGLQRTKPDVTADMLLDSDATLDEMREAVDAVLRLAGLKSEGEKKPAAAVSEAS